MSGPSSMRHASASASTSQTGGLRSSQRGADSNGEGSSSDLWSEILSSADTRSRGRGSRGRKNVILLSERHRGRTYLLNQLAKKGSKQPVNDSLAMGYQAIEVREDGDEGSSSGPGLGQRRAADAVRISAPSVGVLSPQLFAFPASSRPTVPAAGCLAKHGGGHPPRLEQTIFNGKSKLGECPIEELTCIQIRELLIWLHWVEDWAKASAERAQADEMRERLQSHIQHYAEPASHTPGSTIAPPLTSYSGGPLLPLGPGSLTLNPAGVPIVVVCTRADLMDSTGEEVGMKGQWEERTDWVQQVLRTICLAYGAALFYTAPTQPQTYTLLRQYVLHRLYTIPPPLDTSGGVASAAQAAAFPFAHRANVLDRDAVMVPTGWDSHGKINVLRERFDPMRVLKAWENSLASLNDGDEADGETVEDLWIEMIPDTSRPKPNNAAAITTTVEPEQSFLGRQFETLQKDPNRDPRASFRQAAAAVAASAPSGGSAGSDGSVSTGAGVVGPMGTGGLSLPGVEKVMAEMEGGSVEDMKEKFAKLGRRETTRPGPLSPSEGGPKAGTVPNEALHNFFQGLLATKGKSGTPAKSPTSSAASKP